MKKILSVGPFFIILAALLWSTDGLLRVSLYTLPPTVVVFWEHILGVVILLPFILPKLKELKNLRKKEWISMILVGIFSGALGTIFYTAALGKVNFIQFSVVALLQQLQPIWAILTAAILLKEKISKNFVKWAALAIIASYFVTFKDMRVNLTSGMGTVIAAGLALAAGMMWAMSTSFSKVVLNKVGHSIATLLRFVIAPAFIFILLFSTNRVPSLTQINGNQWLTLLIITLSTGLVAQLIYYFGLKKTPARVAAICELTWPASAIFIDYFYFHKGLSPTQIIGVLVLVTAIRKVTKYKK